MNITIVGAGFVGLSLALLLAERHEVCVLDIDAARIGALREGRSPINDPEFQHYLATHRPRLRATLDKREAYAAAHYVIIAVPTDFDECTGSLETGLIERVIEDVLTIAPEAEMVIKSTVPIGFTAGIRQKFSVSHITFSPEFLREGKALHDSMYPSRIVVGGQNAAARIFAQLLQEMAVPNNVPVLFTGSSEAEAIKLFSNTYLAMRVAFFNELDTFAASHRLDAAKIIDGVGLDPRIGQHYNNPSFGYGGYCLPKDSKQLLANYESVPQRLLSAIVDANQARKEFIAEAVLARRPRVVGIYRLAMKAGSNNVKSTSVLGVMERLAARGVEVIAYEPALSVQSYCGWSVSGDLRRFKEVCDLILANRDAPELADVAHKVYTRDLHGRD